MRQALALLLLTAAATYAQAPAAPSIDDLINLKRVGSPAISPDGRQVAFTIRETNWDENAYETEIWIGDAATGQSRQVTNARKSSMQPAWSPDGAWLAFVSDRDGKRQLYRIALRGGEAERLTSTEDGVNAFAWSPSGKQIAFTMQDPVSEAMKEREKRWGDVKIEDQDQRYTHLHVLDLGDDDHAPADEGLVRRRQLRLVARRAPDRVRPSHHERSGGWRQRRHLGRRPSSPARWRSRSRRRDPTRIRAGRPTDARSHSRRRWRKPFYFYQNSVIATVVPGVANASRADRRVRREPRPHRVVAARHPFLGVRADHVAPLCDQPAVESDHETRGPRRAGPAAASRSLRTATRVAFIGSGPAQFPDVYVARDDGGEESQRHRRADRGVAETFARGGPLEEPGRRGDRGRAAQAGGFPGRPPLSVAGRDSRRADRHLAAGAVRQRQLLPD